MCQASGLLMYEGKLQRLADCIALLTKRDEKQTHSKFVLRHVAHFCLLSISYSFWQLQRMVKLLHEYWIFKIGLCIFGVDLAELSDVAVLKRLAPT